MFTGTITAAQNARHTVPLMSGVDQLIKSYGYSYEIANGTRQIIPSVWMNTSGGLIGNAYTNIASDGTVNLLTWLGLSGRTNIPYAVAIEYTKTS